MIMTVTSLFPDPLSTPALALAGTHLPGGPGRSCSWIPTATHVLMWPLSRQTSLFRTGMCLRERTKSHSRNDTLCGKCLQWEDHPIPFSVLWTAATLPHLLWHLEAWTELSAMSSLPREGWNFEKVVISGS